MIRSLPLAWTGVALGGLCASASLLSFAADLPDEPLALFQALSYANSDHPSVKSADLELESAEINLETASSDVSFSIDLTATAAAVEQADLQLQLALQKQRLLIMERFLDVLLADFDYSVKNEKMTIAFLRFNRLREGAEFFQDAAEVDVLAAQAKYQDEFVIRQRANIERQNARRKLGVAMGLEGYVPRDLTVPNFAVYLDREVPEFDALLGQVLSAAPEARIAKLEVELAKHAADVLDAMLYPSVDESDVDPSHSAAMRKNQIVVERVKASLRMIEFALRDTTFELWKQLNLLAVESAAADVNAQYRDLYMDRSRTLYELEVRADLGDAQAELLDALRRKTQVEFQSALVWAQLDLLMGEQVLSHEN